MDNHIYVGRSLQLTHDDSFRLLELVPGDPNQPLKIRLLNSRVPDAPAYEALSYTWGNTSFVSSLKVDNGEITEEGTEMSITANCFAALKRLRRLDQSRLLWVDAICINQSLVPERNHQIALMTRIYQSASRVVVYLGEHQDNSNAVISYFRELDSPSEYGAGNESPPDPAILKAFFKRPWFHRVWVLQEIAFAKEAVLLCGHEEIDWGVLRSFYRHNINTDRRRRLKLPLSVRHASAGSRKRSWTGYLYQNSVNEYHHRLQTILLKSRSCRATDPRDKVYAILSLVESELEKDLPNLKAEDEDEEAKFNYSRIKPDYSLSAAQVFTQVATAILSTIGLQELLEKLAPKSPTPGLPSWVPDWTAPSQCSWGASYLAKDYVFAGFRTKKRSHPENQELIHWSLSDSSRALHLRGFNISKVSVLGPVCSISKHYLPLAEWESLTFPEHHVPEPKPPGSTRDTTHDWWNGPKDLTPFHRCLSADGVVYPDVVERAISRIGEYNTNRDPNLLLLQATKDGDNEEEDGKFFIVDRQKLVAYRSKEEKDKHPLGTEPLEDIFNYDTPSYRIQSDSILGVCEGKRLARTEDGKIGMVPGAAQEGDEIWVIGGLNMAYICRRLEIDGEGMKEGREKNVVRLVGPAYVYGIMAGQAWEGDWESRVEDLIVR